MPLLFCRWIVAMSVAAIAMTASSALAYTFYQYGAGRADYASHYDFAGVMWPGQPGSLTYDFGNIGRFSSIPSGLILADVTTAARNAGNAWETWAHINVGDTLGTAGTGNIRLTYDSSKESGAFTRGYGLGGNSFAEIVIGRKASASVTWNATNFEWTLTHELGHAFGLHDLYKYSDSPGFNEEFADHALNCNITPCRNDATTFGDASRRDNIMDRYRYDSNDYGLAPQTILDNDEIAGISWLWGGKYNQIVTGDLKAAWTGNVNWREIAAHHGGEINARTGEKGWWTYWGSFAPAANEPCITIDFPGFVDYQASIFPNATFTYAGNQGGTAERFCIEAGDWIGNFVLSMKSTFAEERMIDAVLHSVGDGRVDSFILPPELEGRAFQDIDRNSAYFARLFGPVPVPEPATLGLLAVGVLGLGLLRRIRVPARKVR